MAMRKGGETEDFLSGLHDIYRQTGLAFIRKTDPEVYYRYDLRTKRRVIGAKRGPVDYEGVMKLNGIGRAVFFDAKQTQRKLRMSLHKDHVPDHQKAYLVNRAEYGAICFLYISRNVDQSVSRFLYPVFNGETDLLTNKSIKFSDMIALPPSGDWLDWVTENIWMWEV